MSIYYRIELPRDSHVTVLYHDKQDPAVLKYRVPETPPEPPATHYVQQYEVRLPLEAEARVVPGEAFSVSMVSCGDEPLLTDPISSIFSPPRTMP